MAQTKRRIEAFDAELADLPPGARWREWMLRVEAAIFAGAEPVPRQALARLVGLSCNLDDLLADLADELRARPYDLVFVAGGYQLRTKPRFADADRARRIHEIVFQIRQGNRALARSLRPISVWTCWRNSHDKMCGFVVSRGRLGGVCRPSR